MTADPVVIVLCPHADGRLPGRAGRREGHRARRGRGQGARSSAPASRPTQIEQIFMGCVLPAGLGQAPARQAALGAGLPIIGRGDHGQQDVRLGHAGGDHGARRARGRLGRRHRRRRHGEHDQRALPAAEAPRPARASATTRRTITCILDGLEDAYEPGKLMGAFAEETARDYQFTREAQDDFAIESPRARAEARRRRARSSARSSPVDGRRAARATTVVDQDEQPAQGRPRQDPDAQARLRQGRHDHRRQRLLDLRRRRGAGADARIDRRELGLEAGRARSSATPPTRRSRRCSPPRRSARCRRLLDKAGWTRRRRRPVRGQRGLRRGRDDRDARPRHRARQAQRQRRRLRARPPDRRVGRAHPATLLVGAAARGGKRGVAALCIGGGEATAMAVELI